MKNCFFFSSANKQRNRYKNKNHHPDKTRFLCSGLHFSPTIKEWRLMLDGWSQQTLCDFKLLNQLHRLLGNCRCVLGSLAAHSNGVRALEANDEIQALLKSTGVLLVRVLGGLLNVGLSNWVYYFKFSCHLCCRHIGCASWIKKLTAEWVSLDKLCVKFRFASEFAMKKSEN